MCLHASQALLLPPPGTCWIHIPLLSLSLRPGLVPALGSWGPHGLGRRAMGLLVQGGWVMGTREKCRLPS